MTRRSKSLGRSTLNARPCGIQLIMASYSLSLSMWCNFSANVISSILLVIAAPWGKTISYTFGPLLPARISWFFFESPNLFWTCFCWLSGSHNSLPTSNSLLLVLFFLHYVQRAIFYPYRMSSNTTRMPVVVVIAAFCFTVFNG